MAKADSSEIRILPSAMPTAIVRLTSIMRPTGAREPTSPPTNSTLL